ncbi:hypothetical protein QBC43DRAFT_212370 [Cladorrhinum sp. PSN259]|nr:hypothetical protein QBC43DRAFT_212370 [Cladorrhinum sp. PSN259]
MPLRGRTPISPAAQSTIKRAFKDLEQYISITDHKNLQDTTLEDVRQAAHSIEDQLAARQSLRNMRRLLPLFDGLSYYSKTIEVLCNGTPYMAWIWAPIKVILKVASDYVEAFEKIIQGYARIAEPLARFKLFDQAYSKNIHVQETLAVYYADILKFHEHAYKFVRRGGWKNLFHSSWGRFERTFKGIFDDMERHGDSIDKTAAAIHISEAKAMRDALETSRQQSLDALKREEQEMVSSHYLAIVGWLKLDESDQHKILESIASEASNYPGTTDWVTKNPKITSWMRPSHETTFLVLNGHPGTGKSVLASRITTFLKSANASLVISHFCTYSYVTSIEYDQILRSVLAQLIRSNPDLVAHAYDELIRQKKALNSQVLEKLICDLIISSADSPSQTRYIHILLDGLNECDQDQQKKIIRMLERVVSVASSESSGSTICKVLLSTRVTQPVPVRLRQKPTVSIGEEKIEVTKAIRQYSSDRMKRLSGRLKEMQITERDLQDVVNGIADKAAGMFLWARLVLEYLSTNIFYSREEILRAAETLPRKLSEFYGKIITQLLSHLDDRSVKRVKMVLGWIAFAKRPLRKAEFRSALAFGDGDTKVSELPPPYIFDICGPLIEMRKDSSFAFIHVSVKEFLQSPESNIGLSETTACYQHGVSTATCLLSGLETMALACPESERNLRILRGLHAFHTYATEYWTEYLLAIASSSTGLDANSQFFLLSSRLATTLRDLQRGNSDASKDSSSVSDARLVFLEEHPNLHTVAVESISDRGIKDLEEANIADDGGQVVSVTSLKTLLLCYRTVIGSLLSMQTYGGIELEEFARFKVEYRKTAFACRLLSCPRATLGFDSQAELIEHEASHLRIVCKEPFCQYPPFSSVRALKAHQSKCHPKDTGVARRTGIRQSRAKHFTTDDIGNPNKRENLSVGAKNGSDMRSDTTGEVHQTQESQTLVSQHVKSSAFGENESNEPSSQAYYTG